MRELRPIPFDAHLRRLIPEMRDHRRAYDIPERSWWKPERRPLDLRVVLHDRVAGTPVGPAAGPHTQMAQNIVLAYLCGARMFELKTVQIMDRLDIPRPCIDARNIGYNVEWSQELRIEESLHEYAAAAYLVSIIRGENLMDCGVPMPAELDPVVWDISVGYDLKGIQSRRVLSFLAQMRDATRVLDKLDAQLDGEHAHLRVHRPDAHLSNSITLSTFHGCPKDEIEKICVFLMEELGFHVIVKMNPVMLGQERVEHLLRDVLGYKHLETNPAAYAAGLQFDESLDLMRRLRDVASACGVRVGAKFSNTLEVMNKEHVLPASEKVMYLSGAPLHVISGILAAEWRAAAQWEAPLSFSAGVDAQNFPELVACGCVPVTTCTDLLKPGGYGRLPAYLAALEKQMEEAGATTIEEFMCKRAGTDDMAAAMAANWAAYAKRLETDERYSHARNNREPKHIDSHLKTFDCINCDKCIPACPNDAMFAFEVEPVREPRHEVSLAPGGEMMLRDMGEDFVIEKEHQLANLAEWCNECSNCQTYCPEHGGPFIEKPRLFASMEGYLSTDEDGFHLDGHGDAGRRLLGRIGGHEYSLEWKPGRRRATLRDAFLVLELDTTTHEVLEAHASRALGEPKSIDTGVYHLMRAIMEGVFNSETPNTLSALAAE
jgi:putative selenate reductase